MRKTTISITYLPESPEDKNVDRNLLNGKCIILSDINDILVSDNLANLMQEWKAIARAQGFTDDEVGVVWGAYLNSPLKYYNEESAVGFLLESHTMFMEDIKDEELPLYINYNWGLDKVRKAYKKRLEEMR